MTLSTKSKLMPALRTEFEAIGTHWIIDSLHSELLPKVHQRIAEFDLDYSRFRRDSLVAKIYDRPGRYRLPDDARPMLDLYHDLYRITQGKMTPLIGKALSDAGYDAKYSFKSQSLAPPPKWDDIVYEHPYITTQTPILFDFGAAGKGYLIDLVGEILQENFTIDAGGDILHRDESELRVGLEHPENKNQVIGIATIRNQSICGSAGNRRRWGKFHHIINPQTLVSPDTILATWVVAKSALLADALATAVYLEDPNSLSPHYDFEYLILYSDYSVSKSTHFPAELFHT